WFLVFGFFANLRFCRLAFLQICTFEFLRFPALLNFEFSGFLLTRSPAQTCRTLKSKLPENRRRYPVFLKMTGDFSDPVTRAAVPARSRVL
ncbi:MAG: hypothetical protein IKT21_02340, partial [Methanomicrobium sp.]|nr:hypothetical protein [Methanomicrobium sp.]